MNTTSIRIPLEKKKLKRLRRRPKRSSSSTSSSSKATVAKYMVCIAVACYVTITYVCLRLVRNGTIIISSTKLNENDEYEYANIDKEAIMEGFVNNLRSTENGGRGRRIDEDEVSLVGKGGENQQEGTKTKESPFVDFLFRDTEQTVDEEHEIYKQLHHKSDSNGKNNANIISSRVQRLHKHKEIIGEDGINEETSHVHSFEEIIQLRKKQTVLKLAESDNRSSAGGGASYSDIGGTGFGASNSDTTKSKRGSSSANYYDDWIRDRIPKSLLVNDDNDHLQNYHLSSSNADEDEERIMQNIVSYLQLFLDSFNQILDELNQSRHQQELKQPMNKLQFWSIYTTIVEETLYSWDQHRYLPHIVPLINSRTNVNDDGNAIFVSVVSYKDDDRCVHTLNDIFQKASNPELIHIGLVVIPSSQEGHSTESSNCYDLFCNQKKNVGSGQGMNQYCSNNQIRYLRMNQSVSFGPYYTRFFASKLWFGQQLYMQIDSHMHFMQNWDIKSIEMLQSTPAATSSSFKTFLPFSFQTTKTKPILTYLPYADAEKLLTTSSSSKGNHEQAEEMKPLPKICGGFFLNGLKDSQMISLETTSRIDLSSSTPSPPLNIPFVVVGNFITTSDILQNVPFDPFVPFAKGEEILMSTRLWTSGYDFFYPHTGVVSHEYGLYTNNDKRKNDSDSNNQKKYDASTSFWEDEIEYTLMGEYDLFSPLRIMMMDRIKFLLGYPESARDMIKPKSLLSGIEKYGLGSLRTLDEYMEFAGLDVTTKTSRPSKCIEE